MAIGRPTIPFGCRTCGEWRAERFSAGYKTLCGACRATLMRERRAAATGRPSAGPRNPIEKPPPRPKRRASWIDVLKRSST